MKSNHRIGPRLLNIGCGPNFHPAWVNIDLTADEPGVIAHDITRGIPFDGESFDAVYHSHVLEHLRPAEAQQLITECYRVLRPGGILRIVVPDLERIATLYLDALRKAWRGESMAESNYDWMKLELLDQLVRDRSGGMMGQYMADPEISNFEFVRGRIGDEYYRCAPEASEQRPEKKTRWLRARPDLRKTWLRFRRGLAGWCVRRLLGFRCARAFEEGWFRQQGEVHRWMYDRFSMKRLCLGAGFVDFRVVDAQRTQIDRFESYSLDSVGGVIRKPDSLFVECRRPRAAKRAVA